VWRTKRGSIRQPAALCGIVGLRPTYGRVSRYGIVAFASSLAQVGPFARNVRDAAALLHAVAGRDERDSTSAPVPVPPDLIDLPASDDEAAATLRGLRLGLPREYFVAGMEPGAEARVREAVAALAAAGAEIVDVSLPHTDYGLATYYIIAPAEASANLARYDGVRFGHASRGNGDYIADYLATRGSGFGPEVKRRIMVGPYALSAGYYDAYYVKAQKVRTLIKGDFDAAWAGGIDAIVAPTSPTTAFPLGARLADPVAMYLADVCTIPVNVAGLPGVSVPCGLSDGPASGLPVGLQLIGRPWDEEGILRIGRAYEAITSGAPWRRREPAALPALDDPATPTPAERLAPAGGDVPATQNERIA
jgi:aspartyl-tRNA(Asn)/glutamyl-tRNA(Gln) amidotransferase subunit A